MSNAQVPKQNHIVVFALGEPRYALPLSAVERIIRAVEITPLPKAPEIVLGVINMQGEIIPVVDIRKRFRLPSREINVEDQFIIARTSKRFVVLVVDAVAGVYELEHTHIVDAEEAFPYTHYLSGVATIETNIVLIHDLEKFLSLDEERLLDKALTGGDR